MANLVEADNVALNDIIHEEGIQVNKKMLKIVKVFENLEEDGIYDDLLSKYNC